MMGDPLLLLASKKISTVVFPFVNAVRFGASGGPTLGILISSDI
jgi:hypothetical protein